MCGTVKFGRGDTSIAKIGDPVPVVNILDKRQGSAEWSGFAKQERTSWWIRQGKPVPVSLCITTFVEGSSEFKIPAESTVCGLGLTQDVKVQGKVIGRAHTVKVLTREPKNDLERKIHNRWPVVLDKDGRVHIFTSSDLVKGQQELV